MHNPKIFYTFAILFAQREKNTHMHINHEEYYHDRLTESDLCYDFPVDEILIDGLHAMQLHLWSNNVQVDIPVVRVMNAAHFLAAYMFGTTKIGKYLLSWLMF